MSHSCFRPISVHFYIQSMACASLGAQGEERAASLVHELLWVIALTSHLWFLPQKNKLKHEPKLCSSCEVKKRVWRHKLFSQPITKSAECLLGIMGLLCSWNRFIQHRIFYNIRETGQFKSETVFT